MLMVNKKMNDINDFAKWLQDQLDKRGWDCLDLAVEAFLSEQTIKNYLNGTSYPKLDSFMLIVKALGKRVEITDNTGMRWVLK